jgi:hypothetical protein
MTKEQAKDLFPELELGNGISVREFPEHDAKRERAGDEGARSLQLSRAGVVVARAELRMAEMGRDLDIAADDNQTLLLVGLLVDAGDRTALASLLYCAARRARMAGRISLAMRADEARRLGVDAIWRMAELAPSTLMQRVDVAAHYASQALTQLGAPVTAPFRAREVQEVALQALDGAPGWGFFRAVHARTLTREQYVYALSNVYQFVRHTTRLCARAVAAAPTTELRSHWINHLSGEVNHELIIERDLAHLGADVSFVVEHMAPNGPTQQFMANQESLIGYRQDAILLMASPVAAEGVTAHLTDEFATALKECIRGWGVEQPAKAARFFISHMHTDGGDDGHWELTIAFLGKCLVDEAHHQMFMRSLSTALRSTQGLYESFVSELPGQRSPSVVLSEARSGVADVHA